MQGLALRYSFGAAIVKRLVLPALVCFAIGGPADATTIAFSHSPVDVHSFGLSPVNFDDTYVGQTDKRGVIGAAFDMPVGYQLSGFVADPLPPGSPFSIGPFVSPSLFFVLPAELGNSSHLFGIYFAPTSPGPFAATLTFRVTLAEIDPVGFCGFIGGPPVDCNIYLTQTLAVSGVGLASPSPVPIPAALPLFATGLGVVGFLGWRRKRKAAVIGAAA